MIYRSKQFCCSVFYWWDRKIGSMQLQILIHVHLTLLLTLLRSCASQPNLSKGVPVKHQILTLSSKIVPIFLYFSIFLWWLKTFPHCCLEGILTEKRHTCLYHCVFLKTEHRFCNILMSLYFFKYEANIFCFNYVALQKNLENF